MCLIGYYNLFFIFQGNILLSSKEKKNGNRLFFLHIFPYLQFQFLSSILIIDSFDSEFDEWMKYYFFFLSHSVFGCWNYYFHFFNENFFFCLKLNYLYKKNIFLLSICQLIEFNSNKKKNFRWSKEKTSLTAKPKQVINEICQKHFHDCHSFIHYFDGVRRWMGNKKII